MKFLLVKNMNRDVWYANPEVKFLIVQQCKNREIGLLSKNNSEFNVRNIHAHYTNFLEKNFHAFHFYNRSYNVYYSLAQYNKIQMFSFAPDIRKQQRVSWNAECINHTVAFDFGLDFDSEGLHDIDRAYNDCMLVKKDFDKYKIPYSVKFSGGKGFHIRVPFEALPKKLFSTDSDEPNSIFLFLKTVAELMIVNYGIDGGMKTLDLAVFDHRRIWKCDYSWTCETGLIALPLTDEQFNAFNLEMVKPLNVLKAGIRNRGDLQREGNNNGFKNYCSEILGIEI